MAWNGESIERAILVATYEAMIEYIRKSDPAVTGITQGAWDDILENHSSVVEPELYSGAEVPNSIEINAAQLNGWWSLDGEEVSNALGVTSASSYGIGKIIFNIAHAYKGISISQFKKTTINQRKTYFLIGIPVIPNISIYQSPSIFNNLISAPADPDIELIPGETNICVKPRINQFNTILQQDEDVPFIASIDGEKMANSDRTIPFKVIFTFENGVRKEAEIIQFIDDLVSPSPPSQPPRRPLRDLRPTLIDPNAIDIDSLTRVSTRVEDILGPVPGINVNNIKPDVLTDVPGGFYGQPVLDQQLDIEDSSIGGQFSSQVTPQADGGTVQVNGFVTSTTQVPAVAASNVQSRASSFISNGASFQQSAQNAASSFLGGR